MRNLILDAPLYMRPTSNYQDYQINGTITEMELKAVLATRKVDLEAQRQEMLEFCNYSISQVK